MIDNSSVILEDNNKYLVLDKIKDNDISYIYLVNNKNEKDMVVRKEIIQGEDEHYLVELESREELENALRLFIEKNEKE